MKTLKLLLITVLHLKFIQIYYRFYYGMRKKVRLTFGFKYPLFVASPESGIVLIKSISSTELIKDNKFTFLNLSNSFTENMDWNYSVHGKLWTYNLTYFEYLNQENILRDEGLALINDFIDQSSKVRDGLEPFPISLRGINWIKFITANAINQKNIDDSLYAQYMILMDNLEYHLLGNHLLENGFSLLYGAYYFNDHALGLKAKDILFKELNEQILEDGAHFELSPMYHQLMLFRVLDCINLLQNNTDENDKELLLFLQTKASLMLGWLDEVIFNDGSIPLLNDSANEIAPKSKELFEYASSLKIGIEKITLKDSGYRKFENKKYECIVDIGQIGPDYIPGHAHADTFNFELHINNEPFIVDTGTSTYETNARRTFERSTVSHNTVEIEGLSQTEVWSAFRVANRAYVTSSEYKNDYIKAIHNGYNKKLNALHERKFCFDESTINITDTVISDKEYSAVSRIHFHPSVDESRIKKCVSLENLNYCIKDYQFAPEFNLLINAKVLEITFTKKLEIKIEL